MSKFVQTRNFVFATAKKVVFFNNSFSDHNKKTQKKLSVCGHPNGHIFVHPAIRETDSFKVGLSVICSGEVLMIAGVEIVDVWKVTF